MKISSLLFGLGVLTILWILAPVVFVSLNSMFGLPVYIFGMFRFIGTLVVVSGLMIALIASLTFMKFGKGTPAIIEPPKKLVMKGLYKRTRNPIYVGHALISLGLFILFGHTMLLVYTILVILGLHYYLVRIEEPILKKRYGEYYLKYMKRVPRWL